MAIIVGVRFKNAGKIYYFDPKDIVLEKGDHAVVETARGLECGEVVLPNREIDDAAAPKALKAVVRKATPEDVRRAEEQQAKKRQTLQTCQARIDAHKLEMKLVDVEFAFDNSKMLFYFTADGRIDFRELVKDLASLFHTRIELRQIGVRDEAKLLGGLGICGMPFCCNQFLPDFEPVSIKMAKEQGLSLNPTKISGACGRLMCCLKYEQEAYEHLLKITPKIGALVNTAEGHGVVKEVNLLTGQIKVLLDKSPDSPPVAFHRDDVKVIRDGRARPDKAGKPAPAESEDPDVGGTPDPDDA
ncbi:MAG: stage 0 sporulation family protein [Clostridia bacterium]|nr:stage 0 sporulation family protein [Clostridia bacterium]